ncbi:MAG: VWA domain-containing protein, partial [Pirellulaceae bacterium]
MTKYWITAMLICGLGLAGCKNDAKPVTNQQVGDDSRDVAKDARGSGPASGELATLPQEESASETPPGAAQPADRLSSLQSELGARSLRESEEQAEPMAPTAERKRQDQVQQGELGKSKKEGGAGYGEAADDSNLEFDQNMFRNFVPSAPATSTNGQAPARREAGRLAGAPAPGGTMRGGNMGGMGGGMGGMGGGGYFGRAANNPAAAGAGFAIPDGVDGQGPGMSGDKFDKVEENPFTAVADSPLSTFSIDVDTASYGKLRSYLTQFKEMPSPDAVRIEELVNYFTYDYATPTDEHPFAANTEVASCPWNPKHRLVRIGLKGKEIAIDKRPASNLVFLLDVSGSMSSANRLPLVKEGMKLLVDNLNENDMVSIVVYAGAAGMVLEPTDGGQKATIIEALDRLQSGGSTNGGQGIQLAYKTAKENFIQDGINRVILCSDGDFNVGTTSTGDLVRLAEEEAKNGVFVSVLGFGIGNHNDSMLEQISNKANGNYAFIDNKKEAQKVLVEQMSGTLMTIAKDVKIQIEFNPNQVASYRLVGYENRMLAARDFNDDKKDAGEIGAGHTVTAFYEIVPVGGEEKQVAEAGEDAEEGEKLPQAEPLEDDLRYQSKPSTTEAADTDELLTLKLRYKQPESDTSTLMTYPVKDSENGFNQASGDYQFAAGVAMYGMLIRDS